MINLDLVAAPAELPVSLEQLKNNLRIHTDVDDVMLASLIEAATAHLDGRFGHLQRALVTQTWDLHLCKFPSVGLKLRLPLPPLQSVTSIKYWDSAGLEQLMDPSDYEVHGGEYVGTVALKAGKDWPRDLQNDAWPVTVRFIAGFGGASDVPKTISQAIILLASHWFENRVAVDCGGMKEVPMAFKALINPYRVSPL